MVTYNQIVDKIMAMKCNNEDTYTMLKAAEKIPPSMYDKIVSITPTGVYSVPGPGAPPVKMQSIETPNGPTIVTADGTNPPRQWTSHASIECGTDPSAGNDIPVITTTAGTSGDTNNLPPNHVYFINPSHINIPSTPSAAPIQFTWQDVPTDVWDPPPRKTRKKKKAVSPPIKISPRNPGLRRIVLED